MADDDRDWSGFPPVTPQDAALARALSAVAIEPGGAVWWRETRPEEGGRARLIRCLASGEIVDVSAAAGQDERGEAIADIQACLPIGGGAAVVTAHDDHRLYLLRPDKPPHALTPEVEDPAAERYADLVRGPDPSEIICVRESRRADATSCSIVAVPLDGSWAERVLVPATGCLSSPRPSPDGSLLAWVAWDPSRMPWDGSRLCVGPLTARGVGPVRVLLGGETESVFQPEWATSGSLYAVSDRTRWWNLFQVWLDGTLRPLYLAAEEFGWPQTRHDLATYGQLADGRLAVLHGTATWRLDLLDPATGMLAPLDLPYTAWQPDLRTSADQIVGVAGTPTRPAGVVALDARTGRHRVLRQAFDEPAPGYLPHGQPTSFAARDGHQVHATVYPPPAARARIPAGERVPYLLVLPEHPGAQATHLLDLVTVLFTGQGIGVAKVESRGSSGYGRGYREQVYGRWGVADVEDCAVAVRGLVDQWRADPGRLIVRGAGAGAMTALTALATTDLFAAATVYAPITDLTGLAERTPHPLVRYLLQIAADSTSLRSASWLRHLRRPVLMCHGARDRVVPVGQTALLRDALRDNRISFVCVTFSDEGHTFRRAETVSHALAAELSFYARVLGRPPGA